MFEITLSLQKKQLNPVFQYRSFGLNIQSNFEIPELPVSDFETPEITIQYGKNPTILSNILGKGVLYQAKKNDFLFKLDTVGSYRVQNGNSITVEQLNNSTQDEIRLFLLGSAFGALIHQRNLLPFHGSAVVINEKAIVIGGASGAGKSSLAATLIRRGYKLLSDDISVIKLENRKAIVFPGIPHLKLWHDVMKKLEEDIDSYQRVRPTLLKYRKPAEDQFLNKETTLHCIIALNSKNNPGFEITETTGGDKFNLLKNNTYRYQYLYGLDKMIDHFTQVSELAERSRTYIVQRPNTPLLLEELADFIEKKVF